MSTETETTGMDPQVLADLDAVMRRVIDGTPVDPETSRRIRERAERVTEEIHRAHGDVDVNQLLHESRDDA
jgi:hypothetical protein